MKQSTTEHFTPLESTFDSMTEFDRVFDELNGVHTLPAFTQYCADYAIDPTRKQTPEYANAYAAYVEDYAHARVDEGLMDPSYAALLTMGSHFAAAAYAEGEVKAMKKNHDWSRDEKKYFHDTLMPQVITYNRQIVDYLYAHPEADTREVSRLMFATSRSMLDRDNFDDVHDRINALVKGCRTEAMTAHLFDRIGVPYDFGTVQEDARGGDLVITLNNQRILVDLKSSLDGMTGVDQEKALDAVEAGKMYYVTGHNRFKLFMKFDKGITSATTDESMDMAVGAQVMRACNEAMKS